MTVAEYQLQAKRTCPLLGSIEAGLLHMKRGIITECGELVDLIKKFDAYGKQFTHGQVKEELGDLSWYIVNKCTFDREEFSFDNFPVMDIELDLRENVIDKVVDAILQEAIIADKMANARMICLWYTLVEFLGYEVSDVMEININKLKVRYPEGFNQDNAINRNLAAEEATLNT